MLEAINHEKGIKAVIWLGESAGYYLYIYKLDSDRPYRDRQCVTLEQAYSQAELEFGFRKNEFKKNNTISN